MAETSLTRNVLVAAVVAVLMAGFVLAYTYVARSRGPAMVGAPEGRRGGPGPMGPGMMGEQPAERAAPPLAALMPAPEPPLPGVWTAPLYCPIMRAAVFISHAERGIFGALRRLQRFTNRLRAGLGIGTHHDAAALQAARQLLDAYLFSTGNPHLRVGALRDLGEEVEGEIVTQRQEVVERLRVDMRTGALRAGALRAVR